MRRIVSLIFMLGAASALAQTPPSEVGTAPAPARVVISGTVPDEATKVAVVNRLRAVYGPDVIDQVTIGSVVAPPNWSDYVQKLIDPRLKQISHGQMQVNGNTVSLQGEVANEAIRQQLPSDMAGVLSPSYTVKNGLLVGQPKQALLDQTLANRIIEFDSGSATLTPMGQQILDQMAAAMQQLNGQAVVIIGHTSNDGRHDSNIKLSQDRAEAVKAYLVGKGVAANSLITRGVGPDQPIASDRTPEGRARNRRIEFRLTAGTPAAG